MRDMTPNVMDPCKPPRLESRRHSPIDEPVTALFMKVVGPRFAVAQAIGLRWTLLDMLLLLLLPSLVAGGCSPVLSSRSERSLQAAGAYHINDRLDVPEIDGTAGCGSQALAASLARHRESLQSGALAAELPWRDEGATPVDLLLEARSRGFHASVERGTWEALIASAEADEAPVVMLDVAAEARTLFSRIPTGQVMHWAVVSGCAHDGSEVLLGAADARHHVVAREEFMKRWEKSDRCTIIIHDGAAQRNGRPTTMRDQAPERMIE